MTATASLTTCLFGRIMQKNEKHEILTFRYRLPASKSALVLLAAALLAFLFFYLANHPPKAGKTAELAQYMLPSGVRNLFLLLALSSALLALFMLFQTLRSQTSRRYLILGAKSALLPKAALFSPFVRIPYSDIRDVQLQEHKGRQTLMVITKKGQCPLLQKSFCYSEDFARCAQVLRERAQTILVEEAQIRG